MKRDSILNALREAVLTMLAALATMACAFVIDPEPGPVTLAIVLAYSLSRSHLDRDLRGRLEAAVILPIVSLGALAVGVLLLHVPWIGAFVFVAGMGLSVWMRRFGAGARRAGSLIGLPFIVILITPTIPSTRFGPLMAALVPVIVALLALLWVALFHALGRKIRWLPPVRSEAAVIVRVEPATSLRPDASTRMALQMMVALAAAFVIGYVFFAQRWAWVVLTAYIVNAGNQGRLDVAYKSVLRIGGAMFGTVLALTVTTHLGGHDTPTMLLILLAVFLGIWLRPISYAWWALFVTLALALLQGFEGQSSPEYILVLRMQEIVIGAIVGVIAAWLVFPVRSRQVLRRCIADALARLGEALDPSIMPRSAAALVSEIARVESIAPAFRATRWLTRRTRHLQPADWIDVLVACKAPAITLIESGATPTDVRQKIGSARKSMREPAAIQAALVDLHAALQSASADKFPPGRHMLAEDQSAP